MHVSDAVDDDGVVTKVVKAHATYGVRLLLNVGEIQDTLGEITATNVGFLYVTYTYSTSFVWSESCLYV